MTYLAPVPDCRNVGLLLESIKKNLSAEPPPVLPAGDFTADSYYAHLRPEAVKAATDLAAVAMKEQLNAMSSGGDRRGAQ